MYDRSTESMTTFTVSPYELRYLTKLEIDLLTDRLEFLKQYGESGLFVYVEDPDWEPEDPRRGIECWIGWDDSEFRVVLEAITRTETKICEHEKNAAKFVIYALEQEVR